MLIVNPGTPVDHIVYSTFAGPGTTVSSLTNNPAVI